MILLLRMRTALDEEENGQLGVAGRVAWSIDIQEQAVFIAGV